MAEEDTVQEIIRPEIRARMIGRCGREHPFDVLIPVRTALVVIDMQNYFVSPGYLGYVPSAKSIVPNINHLASALRAHGGHVVWIQNTTTGTQRDWSVMNSHLLNPRNSAERIETMAVGHPGFELYEELEIHGEDAKILKTRYSAFIQGSSSVSTQLCGRGVDTVLIAGTATNICCESSARDAMMLNFKTVMIADCLAAYTDLEHEASLCSFYAMFGDVQNSDETLLFLDRGIAQAVE